MSRRHAGLASLLLIAAAAVPLAGCDEPEPGSSRHRPKQATPTPESVVGRWAMDADVFLDENWKLFLGEAAEGIERLQLGEARLRALPPAEQAAARAQVDARIATLPPPKQAAVRAALAGPAALKAFARDLIGEQIKPDTVTLEFRGDGTCTFVSQLPNQRRSVAEGVWGGSGASLTIELKQVDGKPAKGTDLRPVPMTLRGGMLRFKPKLDGPTIVAKRI